MHATTNHTASPKVSIIIPAFNESASIRSVINGFAQLSERYQIIVVDDGSTDETGEILSGMTGVRVLKHNGNRGYGASLLTGIREAQSEIIVTFDADGQHDHRDVVRLLQEIDHYAMIVGARTRDSHFDGSRSIGRKILFWIANLWTGSKIPDINSGLRAFHRNAALRYESLLPAGFSFTTTLTLAMLKEKYPVRFVPIVTRKRVGRSTFRRVSHGLRVLRGVFRLMVLFHFAGRLSAKPHGRLRTLGGGNPSNQYSSNDNSAPTSYFEPSSSTTPTNGSGVEISKATSPSTGDFVQM